MNITLKRILAYLFDIIIVSSVSSLIASTTINPSYEERLTLNQEYTEKIEEFDKRRMELDESDEEGASNLLKEMNGYYNSYLYRSSKNMLFENSISIILMFLYFVVFAYFFEGETVGKRIMKIKVVDKEGKRVKFTSLIIRLLILQGLPLTFITMVLPFILNESAFVISSYIISILTFALEIAILATTFNCKENRGLHDILAKTKVILRERN